MAESLRGRPIDLKSGTVVARFGCRRCKKRHLRASARSSVRSSPNPARPT